MRLRTFLLLAFAVPAAAGAQSDETMIRWVCDPARGGIALEMVRPPVPEVAAGEVYLLSQAANFVQCRLGDANWTLLVDTVEYASGRCEPEPDTVLSLLRDDKLVMSTVTIGDNCFRRPVLRALRVSQKENADNPGIELCTARRHDGAQRCSSFRLQDLGRPVDNGIVATHARQAAP